MKQPVFKGSCTALITPFCAGGIDFERMKKLLDFQMENGTKAIVLAGTTGENATLEIHEYESLVDLCISHVDGRMKMIAGIGGNDPSACLKKARFAQRHGADAVLMTTPYYNKTTQQGLIAHFSHVADGVEKPLILYNVPGRTSIGISAETYRELAKHPNINGTKEASGDFTLISRISALKDELFLWSGNDDHTIPMMALGALGVISVASNIVPAAVEKLCRLCLKGEFSAAAAYYAEYADLIRLLFSETNPIPLKSAMSMAGFDSGTLRLPLVGLSEANRQKLEAEMKKLGLLAE